MSAPHVSRPRRFTVFAVVLVAALLLALLPSAALAAPAQSSNDYSGWSCRTYHQVTSGQTLSGIARWYGVTVQALQQVNYLPNPNLIFVGQVLCIPYSSGGSSSSGYHVVRAGETLSGIARYYGTTWQCLASYNGIPNPNFIRVGQVIYIVYC